MKRIITVLVLACVCFGLQAQIISSTSRTKIKPQRSADFAYSGLQLEFDGICAIGPYWYFLSGAEFAVGYRFDWGLYLGGQTGGGWGEIQYKYGSRSGAFFPIRADIRYYFSQARVQPYAAFDIGMLFLFCSSTGVHFNYQVGPGVLIGINDVWSLQGAVQLDFAAGDKLEGPALAPTVKLGATYHF